MPMMGSSDALVHHLPAATDGTRGFRRQLRQKGFLGHGIATLWGCAGNG